MEAFFQSEKNKSVLLKFRTRIEGFAIEGEFENSRNQLIELVVDAMIKEPEFWDLNCQININWIGNSFITVLTAVNSNETEKVNKDRLDDIGSMCFRFLLEVYLSIKSDLSREFDHARKFVLENISSFNEGARGQIEYAIRDMPIAILKQLINSDAISNIREFNEVSSNADALRKVWDQEVSEKEARVSALKESLNEYENAFNFVGLYDGFNDLAKEKNTELDSVLFWIRILSVLVVLPVLIELGVIYLHVDDIAAVKDGLLVSAIPTLSLVAIAVYYFRVLLFNYKSVKSQLLQIDLRKTLCRFIQHYADYSSALKTKDQDALSKFEDIVFSRIVTSDEKMPSTYDGIEEIGKLFSAAK